MTVDIPMLEQLRQCAALLAQHGVQGPYTVKMGSFVYERLKFENGGCLPAGFRFEVVRDAQPWAAHMTGQIE